MKLHYFLILIWMCFSSFVFAIDQVVNADGSITLKLTAEEKAEILKEQIDKQRIIKTNAFTFDMATFEGCEQFKRYLIVSSLNGIDFKTTAQEQCYNKEAGRYLTVFLSENVSDNNFIKYGSDAKIKSNKLPFENIYPNDPTKRAMVEDTLKMMVVGAGVIGGIAMLPEDVSNWNEENKGYIKNIKKGFHMDEDNWFINWFGHPWSGAQYYLLARHNGLSKWSSFGYTFLMSTFFWEMGIEAYFEQPSWQDFFITPIMGALMGMSFEYAIAYIEKNKGKLLGSKIAGGVAMFFMDPTNPLLDKADSGAKWLKDHNVRLYFVQPEFIGVLDELEQGLGNYAQTSGKVFSGLFLELKF